jgi:integrase
VLASHKINLTERLREGNILSPAECEFIVKASKLKSTVIIPETTNYEEIDNKPKSNRLVSLEKYRAPMKSLDPDAYVDAPTTAIRLGYIRAFLIWRANREILRSSSLIRTNLIELRNLVDVELKNMTPTVSGRTTLGGRMGIDLKSQVLLRHVVMPDHPQNPWKSEFTKARNQLIINALLTLGIRRGELLGLRVTDLRPQMQEIFIMRRPDDAQDSRLDEPNTKTRDRLLPLTTDLYRLVKVYLSLRHEIVRGSHNFLIVANNSNPLSKSGLQRIFDELNNIPGFPMVGPHILRHTFFENLAEELTLAGIGDTEILGYLRQQGGWSDTSNTPSNYIKRFAQERANEAAMSLQEKLLINFSSGVLDE